MRSLLSIILGILSVMSILLLSSTAVAYLALLDLWLPLLFVIFVFACWLVYFIPALGTTLASRAKRWVLTMLYAFQLFISIQLVSSILSKEGFALFYIIPYASIGLLAVGSAIKMTLGGISYDSRLKELQQAASYYGASADEFLREKTELDREYTYGSRFGFLILVLSIIIPYVILSIISS